MLKIRNLTVKKQNKKILDNINLDFQKGKVYAIMGPNGSGKSTLIESIMGICDLSTSSNSKIIFKNKNLLNLKPNEIFDLGIFCSYQNPVELSGVSILDILSTSIQSDSVVELNKKLTDISKKLGIDKSLISRPLNLGSSGGEKKKLEFLQAVIFNKEYNFFDEIDSGLDTDFIIKLTKFIHTWKNNKSLVFISHSTKFIKQTNPDKVFVIKNGKIIEQNGKDLIEKIEKKGYSNF